MDNLIINMLNALGEGPVTPFADLLKSPEQHNSGLYSAAVTLHNTAVKPLTGIILAIVLIMMLASASTRINGDRELGVRIISGIMLKAGLVVVFASQALTILQAIDEVSTTIAAGAMDADIGGSVGETALGNDLSDSVKDASTTDKLGMLVIIMIPFMVSQLVGVLALVLIFVRFIQLYMMTVFASLPIAFIAYEETKQMGIGYLKRYASTALSGVVIILALKLYQALLGSWLTTNVSVDGDTDLFAFATSNFGNFMVAPVVLGFVLFGATQLSKALVGDA